MTRSQPVTPDPSAAHDNAPENPEDLSCSECAELLGATRQACGGLCERCFAIAWAEHEKEHAD